MNEAETTTKRFEKDCKARDSPDKDVPDGIDDMEQQSGHEEREGAEGSKQASKSFKMERRFLDRLRTGTCCDRTGAEDSPLVPGHEQQYTCVREEKSGIWILIPNETFGKPTFLEPLFSTDQRGIQRHSEYHGRDAVPFTHETKPAEKPGAPISVSFSIAHNDKR